MVVRADLEDVEAISAIAGRNNKELGFVMKVSIKEHIKKQSLYVYKEDGIVMGFVIFNVNRKGFVTIYEIATDKEYRGKGIARELMRKLNKLPIKLKVTEDNPANDFYKKVGGKIIAVEKGKKRRLNVFMFDRNII